MIRSRRLRSPGPTASIWQGSIWRPDPQFAKAYGHSNDVRRASSGDGRGLGEELRRSPDLTSRCGASPPTNDRESVEGLAALNAVGKGGDCARRMRSGVGSREPTALVPGEKEIGRA